ncbi:MAG TPA: amidohydrolase family protein [Acidimicrobiales bacterium]|nr:amidohydrolase family protein [Acidimicrobiales bacterium]
MPDNDQHFIYVRERRLPYETFDADNHLYETRDALTKFLPREYEGAIRYVDVEGRTKLALRDQISHYIPNPTFAKVAVPGGWGNTAGNRGQGGGGRQSGVKPRVMPGVDAFFDPEPRLELMKDMGIDRTLLWPTLASVLEERVADDPDLVVAVVHALNEWMHEHWSYVYSDAIYATPIISLAAGAGRALEELAYIHERGAKIFLLRVAPVPTWKGRKSFALPEFDPFWEEVQRLDIVVGMHSGDAGYQRYVNEWEGITNEMLPFKATGSAAFQAMMSEKSVVHDAVASIIGHGLATRFPRLKFMPVEYWADWIRPFVDRMQAAYEKSPVLFDEDPFEVFTRNIYLHIFHEPDPKGLLDMGIPADRLMFGSDFPHPEGLGDPLAYSEVVGDLAPDVQALIMGGTIAKALKVGAYAA